VRLRPQEAWFVSPFRPNERTASFKVDVNRNVWFDHGMGAGGTIIDLVRHLYATNDVARVLAIIADVSGGVARATEALKHAGFDPRHIKPVVLESVGVITSAGLEAYVQSRAIPLDLARMYLQEVQYRVEDRRFRALGFANNAGGFEVRNEAFKGTVGTKDITVLPAARAHPSARVYEGFFDFLSDLSSGGTGHDEHTIVLNSVSLVDRAARNLKEQGIKEVLASFDNDEA
jgi:Toprim-like